MIVIVIQIDSREQKYDYVLKYMDDNGIKYVRSKCVVGDYVNLENPMVVIDRKQSLQEVVGNVTTQHTRFVRELELAKELGFKLIVLIEEPDIKTLGEVPSWYNWRLKKNPKAVSGKKLYRIMTTMQEKYDVNWIFTTKAKCGKKIVELLGGG